MIQGVLTICKYRVILKIKFIKVQTHKDKITRLNYICPNTRHAINGASSTAPFWHLSATLYCSALNMKSLKYVKHNISVWYLFRNLRNKISLKLPTRCYRVNAGDFWLWIDTGFLSVHRTVYTVTGVETICIVVEVINDHHWLIEDLLVC